MSKAPSESAALREVRRALRWLKRAEKTLAAQERAERKRAKRDTKPAVNMHPWTEADQP